MKNTKIIIQFSKHQILKKILGTITNLPSVVHKTGYFKINLVVSKKEHQEKDSFGKEQPSVCIFY